jgi:demethylmacrocin O-methyltransferase
MSTDTALVESILLTACFPDPDITARVVNIGADNVAEAMLAEVASRAALLSGPTDKLVIQCDLGFGGERLGYLLNVGNGGASVEKGWDGEASATVRQDLVDLLRELFGPVGPHGATRELFAQQLADEEYNPIIAAATRQLVDAMSQRPHNLSDLAVRFGSDKWGGRWYTPHYQKYFEPYREQAVKVLEIGIGGYSASDAGGESLRMWKHYFRRGLIYGLDVFEKTGVAESRVMVVQGDAGDERFLDSMARELGPFDIVIDDGSHMSQHIIPSFEALFPHVRPGGLYVVEDLASAYWPGWGGDPDPSAQYRSMEMIKNLLDDVHHNEQIRDGNDERSMTELMVTGVHVHHNLAVIEKGLNTEQGAPEWLRTIDHTSAYND